MTTKTSSVTANLDKYRKAFDARRVTVSAIQQERRDFEIDTDRLKLEYQAVRDTDPEEAAKLDAELKARFPNGPFDLVWPEQDKLDQAIAKMHAAEQQAMSYRIKNLELLIDEAEPTISDFHDEIRDVWQALSDLIDRYRQKAEAVSDLLLDTPPLNRGHLAYDSRIDEWAEATARALIGLDRDPLTHPRVSDRGCPLLDELRERLDDDDES